MKRNYKENQNLIEFMEMISATLTPDFSAEDWLNLIHRASEGDSVSAEMLMNLWDTKVNPFLPPECRTVKGVWKKEEEI